MFAQAATANRKRKQAAQAILDRNAEIIHALHGKRSRFPSLLNSSDSTNGSCEMLRARLAKSGTILCYLLAALQKVRRQTEPTATELSLAQEAKDNMLSLALSQHPDVRP